MITLDNLIDFFTTYNWQTLIGMFAICWYFTHELRADMKNIRIEMKDIQKDMKDQFAKTDLRIDKLYSMFVDLLKERK